MNKEKVQEFLLNHDFKLVKEEIFDAFGDYLKVFNGNEIGVILFSSKSDEMIDLFRLDDSDTVLDILLFKALILQEENLNEITSGIEMYQFLLNNYEKIFDLLSKKNYLKTKHAIRDLGNKRAKQMFGDFLP